MQVASSAYPPSQPLNHYQAVYHPSLPASQDHELKRRYLALLPPQQVIEICLTFDLHVPPYAKSTIWPLNISAAIAALRKPSPELKEDAPKNSTEEEGGAIMDSLTASSSETSPISEGPQSKPSEEPRPPDKEREEPNAGASNALVHVVPQPTTTSAPAPAAPSAYPQQPYGYPYPHAPYYPPPPPGYPYSHPQYPPYPPYPHQPQPGYPPPPPASMYSVPPTPHLPTMAEGNAGDDLPSYEEMIVEALMDSTDPEGCAPKDLFAWMASRYPLQSNFRPSASQALQKAYKRGRLEKSSNNKYRLNAAWEGGNTSRRTTRRPQTHNHTTAPSNPASSSPFTHAPLVHHHHHQSQAPQHQPYPSHPYGYPFAHHGYPGYPPPPPPPLPSQAQAAASPKSDEKPTADTSEANTAYEAAQNILKAINFGSLLQLPAEETQEGTAVREPSSNPPGTTHSQPFAPPPASAVIGSSAGAEAAGPVASEDPPNPRAELQARLVLLAAQLAEFARVEEPVVDSQPQAPLPEQAAAPLAPPVQQEAPSLPPPPPISDTSIMAALEPPEGEDDSDDDDMEAVI